MAKFSKVSPNHDPFKASDGIAAELAGLSKGNHLPDAEERATRPSKPSAEPKRGSTPPQREVAQESMATTEPTMPLLKPPKAQPTKRLKVTADERREWDQAALRMGARVGTTTGFSKMTRALWDIYLRHEEDILRNIPEGTTWECPSTSNVDELAALDHNLAELLNDGLMAACLRTRRNSSSQDD